MNLDDLRRRRSERFFEAWDGFVPIEYVRASEAILLELVDGLLSLEPNEDENGARLVVKRAVIRFNELNDGWLCTIEREDITLNIVPRGPRIIARRFIAGCAF